MKLEVAIFGSTFTLSSTLWYHWYINCCFL